jgi:uncharacterized membrane protein YeiH
VTEPRYLIVCVVVGMGTWLVAHRLASRLVAVLWADAVGMAFYTVMGTKVGLDAGTGLSVAVLMGVMTAAFGGIVRDVLANEPSLILRREIYISACAAGAFVYIGLDALGVGDAVAMVGSFAVTFAVRGAALAFGLSLPGYRAKIEKARENAKGNP